MPVSTIQMRVHKYIPDRLYGFAADEGGREVFFHLGAFDPGPRLNPASCVSCPLAGCAWSQTPPPPILGELVEVQVDLDQQPEDRAPRADKVRRLGEPDPHHGMVETFDALRGFGFVKDGEVSYHLHKSEVVEGKIPLAGQKVSFYAGRRQDRPRACHVKVCP